MTDSDRRQPDWLSDHVWVCVHKYIQDYKNLTGDYVSLSLSNFLLFCSSPFLLSSPSSLFTLPSPSHSTPTPSATILQTTSESIPDSHNTEKTLCQLQPHVQPDDTAFHQNHKDLTNLGSPSPLIKQLFYWLPSFHLRASSWFPSFFFLYSFVFILTCIQFCILKHCSSTNATLFDELHNAYSYIPCQLLVHFRLLIESCIVIYFHLNHSRLLIFLTQHFLALYILPTLHTHTHIYI